MEELTKEEKDILHHLKSGRWSDVEQIAFSWENDPNNIHFRDDILKVSRFWQKRLGLLTYTDEYTGLKLFEEWEHFVDFCCEYQINNYHVFLSVKSFILKKIIDFLSKSSREKNNSSQELLIFLAYAFYEAEILDRAVVTLEFILGRFQDVEDARVYTLLGDLYAEIYAAPHEKQDLAIIMFNELFLKCVDSVDINNIEYSNVQKLIQAVRLDHIVEQEVKYWIPVYGYLYGGLTVRRNLRYEEYKKLQDSISMLETEVRENERLEILIPKLLNVYFWVFDYYVYQMKTLGGATQICRRVLELFAILYNVPGYEETSYKLGLHAEKVLDMLLKGVQNK